MRAKNKFWIAGGIFLLLFFVGGWWLGFSLKETSTEGAVRCPDGTEVFVRIADESKEQVQGLGGVAELSETEGMLFLYKEPWKASHWMKEMLIPIDILWLLDGTVVFIAEEVPVPIAGEELVHYRSSVPANQVLEVSEGFVAKHGILVGDYLDVQVP